MDGAGLGVTMTGSDMATETRRLSEGAVRIGADDEQGAQLQRQFLKLLMQSAEITVDGEDLPDIVETIDAPPHAMQSATTVRGFPRETEPDGASAARQLHLQENADRISARERQIARLQKEFQQLQLQSAEITVGGVTQPDKIEAIASSPETAPVGDHCRRAGVSGPWYLRAPFFIGSMAAASVALTIVFAYFSWRTNGEFTIAHGLLWLSFLPLFFNNTWMLWHAAYYFFLKQGVVFPERPLETFPKTAIIYFVRKEATGLFERLAYTYRNN